MKWLRIAGNVAFWGSVYAAALMVLALAFSLSASASVWTPKECEYAAIDVGRLSDMKDTGATWDAIAPKLQVQLQMVVGGENTYIHDEQDMTKAFSLAYMVWHADLPKEKLMEDTYNACVDFYKKQVI